MPNGAGDERTKSKGVSEPEKQAESPGAAFTERIKRDKQRLRLSVAEDPQLRKDFDFLISKTGWDSEFLVARLFWDKYIMHAEPRVLLGRMKREDWPIARRELERIIKDARALAEQIERVNGTDFSPAQILILRDEFGERFSPAKERGLLESFARLPEILRIYAGELRRKVLVTVRYAQHVAEGRAEIVKDVRKTNVFELLRSTTGQYHATRLLRLVNAARAASDLPPITHRAFIVWLNRLKKRHSAESAASVS